MKTRTPNQISKGDHITPGQVHAESAIVLTEPSFRSTAGYWQFRALTDASGQNVLVTVVEDDQIQIF
jgi:hypothetical protein